MANYLRPKRGKKTSAVSQNLILKNGEIFFEVPETGVGTGEGKLKMGDGITAYNDLPYFLELKEINVSDSKITFTEDPSDSQSVLLNKIVSGAKLNTIIGAQRKLLSIFSSSITQLNNDLEKFLPLTGGTMTADNGNEQMEIDGWGLSGNGNQTINGFSEIHSVDVIAENISSSNPIDGDLSGTANRAISDRNGNRIDETYIDIDTLDLALEKYLPLTAGNANKLTSCLAIEPTRGKEAGEGGQINLFAAEDDKVNKGIVIDNYNSKFRIFTIENNAQENKIGEPLVIDPIARSVSSVSAPENPYTFNGNFVGSLTGTASNAANSDNLDGHDSSYFATADHTHNGLVVVKRGEGYISGALIEKNIGSNVSLDDAHRIFNESLGELGLPACVVTLGSREEFPVKPIVTYSYRDESDNQDHSDEEGFRYVLPNYRVEMRNIWLKNSTWYACFVPRHNWGYSINAHIFWVAMKVSGESPEEQTVTEE